MSEEKYVKVEVLKYVKKGLEDGTLLPFEAVKFGRVIARPGVIGETIISWSVDENGEAIKEKEVVVGISEKTGKVKDVLTKADDDGVAIVDKHGHINQWVVDTVDAKYVRDTTLGEGVYRPKDGVQIFVQIPDNIILEQWGSEMKVAAGGYINITNPDDMYAISSRDFTDTYRAKTTAKVKTKKNQ